MRDNRRLDLLFLIDKHEVVWYTKYTKRNREKEPYFEIIYACRRVQNSKVANVFTERLADVWISQMEQYRDYTKFEKCSKCELLEFCRGCPAVASGRGGNFYAADPQCWKEVI